MSLLAVALAQATPTDPIATSAELFDRTCLHAFPDDQAMATAVAAEGATPLSDSDVHTILRDDPGRGWSVSRNGVTYRVILELPRFHACSIHLRLSDVAYDLAPIRGLYAEYRNDHPGFAALPAIDTNYQGSHLSGVSWSRKVSANETEALIVAEQTFAEGTDKRVMNGAYLRFVRQVVGAKR